MSLSQTHVTHGEHSRLADVKNELHGLYRKKARLLDLLTDSDNPDPGERKALDDLQRQIDGLETARPASKPNVSRAWSRRPP